MAWKSVDKMDKILKSGHDEKLKVMLFGAPTETIHCLLLLRRGHCMEHASVS